MKFAVMHANDAATCANIARTGVKARRKRSCVLTVMKYAPTRVSFVVTTENYAGIDVTVAATCATTGMIDETRGGTDRTRRGNAETRRHGDAGMRG